MASYGENFRRLRGEVSQEEIARRLKLKRQANISAIELGSKVPSPNLILKHAAALHQPPSALMADVQTEYDRIRSGVYDSVNGSHKHTVNTKQGMDEVNNLDSVPKRDGHKIAIKSVVDRKTAPLRQPTAPLGHSLHARLEREVAAFKQDEALAHPPGRVPRTARKHAATTRPHTPSDRVRLPKRRR